MPLPWPDEFDRRDRLIYRRWVDGLFAIYCGLSVVAVTFVAYQTMRAPAPTLALGHSADAKSTEGIATRLTTQAAKYD